MIPDQGVVVIGAGVGGLAVAIRLAVSGHRVTVLEQADRVGGKLASYERDGLRFDLGPTLLTVPDLLREVFEISGGWPEQLRLSALDTLADYRFADGSGFQSTSKPAELTARVNALAGPVAAGEWLAVSRRARAIWEATFEPFLAHELRGARSLLRLLAAAPRDLRVIAPGQTLAGYAGRALSDQRLRDVLCRYATYSGSDPRQAPAALLATLHAEQSGGWYVQGGLARLAPALAERASSLGADIQLDCDVAAVTTHNGRVNGVRLCDGEFIPAGAVVSDVDAAHLYSNLLPRPRLRPRGHRSYSGFTLLLGLRGPRPPDLAHHTVLFGPHYRSEFIALGDRSPRAGPVREPTLTVCAPDDSQTATDQLWPASILVNAPLHGELDWRLPDLAHDYAEHLLDVAARRGLPLRDRLQFSEFRTPADVQDSTRSGGGAIYGSSSDGVRAAFLRPANRSPVPGLYLAGGTAHPGGGLPLVLLSAKIAAALVGDART